ncbi:hypothetical protein [Halarcobacter anaerophilus]|uniref:Uncharacterized protein n=1 Tax=Halarcobacter anaerophilus TaxID=877500 RepID=A0A4Q0Y7R0_9BACT|nr:hypothetical protein [Halarcobacter anaerophilus]QDF29354.1 hypothetical protein AANAER_1881 [Halarcobacter anaerophilus]RXJ64601.1 hypothetical protein CRV06_01190 [Halarcobacter anaerophilus]
MSGKLNHDSTKTFKPIIYQFLVALEKCFEMQNDESIWIEKYGDVTNSDGVQIEVKDYQKDLTDLDHNIWKTMKNWLDDGFNISYYHSFILLTTQTISPNSKFIEWNIKDKNQKLEILNSIADEYNHQLKKAKKTQMLLDRVLDANKNDKLLEILDIFIIESGVDNDEVLYDKFIETRTDGIIEAKRDEYIDSLVGYIIKPEITSGGWEIKNKDFRQKTTSLIETYTSTTKVFPKVEMNPITEKDLSTHQSYSFVNKIEDIEYKEVKSDVISDFIYARRILNEELKNFEISKKEYDSYEDEIFRTFESKRRKALRSANSSNCIDKSKDLYDDVTGENSPDFYNYNYTPKKYRNGLLHEIANDEENPNKLVWKLEVSDE